MLQPAPRRAWLRLLSKCSQNRGRTRLVDDNLMSAGELSAWLAPTIHLEAVRRICGGLQRPPRARRLWRHFVASLANVNSRRRQRPAVVAGYKYGGDHASTRKACTR